MIRLPVLQPAPPAPFFKRTPEACEIVFLPASWSAVYPAAVKIDKKHLPILVDQYVVRVEVGVTDTRLMQAADERADPSPGFRWQPAGLEHLSQTLRVLDFGGNQIGPVIALADRHT